MKKTAELDPPELSQDWFDKARPAREVLPPELLAVLPKKSMGRPRVAHPKEILTMRVDADVLAALRATGQGWQTKVNALLRKAVAGGKV
jgi:uncharacterized protein (DUF4415 family)